MLSQILFTKDNVEDVLRISDRLQVIPVKDACAVWLEKEMDAFNVLETILLYVSDLVVAVLVGHLFHALPAVFTY